MTAAVYGYGRVGTGGTGHLGYSGDRGVSDPRLMKQT